MRFFDLDHKIHQNQNHEITKISKIKIMRSQDFFDLELVDQKIMDHKYDPQFYDLIFDLPTVKKWLVLQAGLSCHANLPQTKFMQIKNN